MVKYTQYLPPQWAIRFLNWFCPDYLIESIEGDLLESFQDDVKEKGLRKAQIIFGWSVLKFFHPYIFLKNRKVITVTNMGLFTSHLTVAWRSMLKNRFYSVINILGLVLAIAFVFLSYLFVYHEMSYDKFHVKGENLYRLYTYTVDNETGDRLRDEYSGVTPIPLAADLKASLPEISRFTRLGSNSGTISIEATPFDETFTFVDPTFLEMFSFPMIVGDRETALDDPSSVVISNEMSTKYFQGIDPIGKSLEINVNDSVRTYIVSGVVDNKGNHSSIEFDFLLSFERFGMLVPERVLTSYNIAFTESYVEFRKTVGSEIGGVMTSVIENISGRSRSKLVVEAQNIEEVHLDSDITGIASFTNPQKLWIMSGLAVLVLVIATINFITLSTGHGMKRVKEIGLRKTLGAYKNGLRYQLIFEAFFLTLIAGVLGIGTTKAIVPFFNELLDASITFNIEGIHLAFFLGILFIISVVSGGLQSSVLLRYSPVNALKGSKVFSTKENWLNQVLIVIQFSLSIMLVIGTFVMREQMHYIQNKDLGFEKQRLVQVNMHSSDDEKSAKQLVDRFRSEVSSNPQIQAVGASMNSFQDPWTELSFQQVEGDPVNIYYNQVDFGYINAMNIELLEGAQFTSTSNNASTAIMVNETLVKLFGWENPFEEQIPGKNFDKSHRIIGVVKDFHFSSLHNTIEPLILALDDDPIASGITGLSTYVWPSNLHQIMVRIGPGDLSSSITFLEDSWKKVNRHKPFTYDFVDDILARNYAEEARWRKVIDAASIFAIIIAWMGLLGLTRLSVQKRVKEIGIRKVMGSSVFDVTSLLSRRFLILVVVAMVLSFPVAWIALQKWLETFSYRIDLNILLFAGAGLLVLTVSIISVGLQSIRAALANPVESLRYE